MGEKKKTHTIILTDEDNAFDNDYHLFIIC